MMYNTTVITAYMEELHTTSNVRYALTQGITSNSKEDCTCNIPFLNKYATKYHGYISIAVCVLGIICNVTNITVLMQKDMVSGAINRILIGLAVADLLLMVEYIPFSYYYYFALQDEKNFPYMGTLYMLFHNHLSQVLHTISICMTLTLAVWRYLVIRYPRESHIYCSDRRCTVAIFLSFVVPLFVCSPVFVIFTIKSVNITEDGQIFTLYYMSLSQIGHNDRYLVIVFWLYAVFIKLLPCSILTCISYSLVKTLHRSKERKRMLHSYEVSRTILNEIAKKKHSKAERKTNRTTRLLLAVLFFFLMTELPQGILGLIIGVVGKCFFVGCYQTCWKLWT